VSICFHFEDFASFVTIGKKLPQSKEEICALTDRYSASQGIIICDENTTRYAGNLGFPAYVLPAGERYKSWQTVEPILRAAKGEGLGRDGLFIGLGGGVICDCTAFASSLYMRGAHLALIPTTLLCMIDASLGGKTGINLYGIKNLAGTFYPAKAIIIALDTLKSLPPGEWKSGMAELIKAAILDPDPEFFTMISQKPDIQLLMSEPDTIQPLIEKALMVKGRIVEKDPRENPDSAGGRALLNLGHTFGHALESAMDPGKISHGEATAWGIARSCELGQELGITPQDRAEAIQKTLKAWGFRTGTSIGTSQGSSSESSRGTSRRSYRKASREKFREALLSDKKKKNGKLRFVVPMAKGAALIEEDERVIKYLDTLINGLL
jgi:3-dehydroquinate synthase